MTTYAVMLQATADDRASVHALRAVLKFAKRRGLVAVDVCQLPSTNNQTIRRRGARRQIANPTQRRNKDTLMAINLRKYGPANKWIKLEDLLDKPPLRERIGLVKIEDGKFGERVVLVLEPSGKMVSLNKTSVGNLLKDFGEEDDDWLGRLVDVGAGTIPTQNGIADAVVVTAVVDMPADAVKVKKASDDMDDAIPFS